MPCKVLFPASVPVALLLRDLREAKWASKEVLWVYPEKHLNIHLGAVDGWFMLRGPCASQQLPASLCGIQEAITVCPFLKFCASSLCCLSVFRTKVSGNQRKGWEQKEKGPQPRKHCFQAQLLIHPFPRLPAKPKYCQRPPLFEAWHHPLWTEPGRREIQNTLTRFPSACQPSESFPIAGGLSYSKGPSACFSAYFSLPILGEVIPFKQLNTTCRTNKSKLCKLHKLILLQTYIHWPQILNKFVLHIESNRADFPNCFKSYQQAKHTQIITMSIPLTTLFLKLVSEYWWHELYLFLCLYIDIHSSHIVTPSWASSNT